MDVNRRGFFIALSLLLLAGADTAFALSCGILNADMAVNGPNSSANIFLGVPVSARIVNNPEPGSQAVVGELKIVETLRGTSPGSLRLERRPPDPTWGTPGVRIGMPYLVLQSEDSDGVFQIGLCTYPLHLDEGDVTIGDGCMLYRMRELLDIEQLRSHTCEVMNRQRNNRRSRDRDIDHEALQEELLRAKWLDRGVDWGG